MLKVLCHIKTSYPPNATSGADIMCERINTYLASNGCEVITVVDQNIQPYEYKGVKVVPNYGLGDRYKWADVIITHLINRSESTALAVSKGKPLFHVCHNDNTSTLQSDTPNNYIIYNSEHLRQASPVKLPGIVVNPPTWVEDFEFTDHWACSYNTLINCVENKGAEMLYQLAGSLPSLLFRGIRGGYGQQIEKSTLNHNLQYRSFTSDVKTVYEQTRVILIPSLKESWSLVGAEAQACGIPVICSDLPGLRENLEDGAIYCPVGGKAYFIEAVIKLNSDKEYYKEFALKGRANAESKNYKGQLDNLLNFMCMKAGKAFDEIMEPVISEFNKDFAGTALDETGLPLMPTEKVEINEEKEKKEFSPFPEKRKRGRPSTKK